MAHRDAKFGAKNPNHNSKSRAVSQCIIFGITVIPCIFLVLRLKKRWNVMQTEQSLLCEIKKAKIWIFEKIFCVLFSPTTPFIFHFTWKFNEMKKKIFDILRNFFLIFYFAFDLSSFHSSFHLKTAELSERFLKSRFKILFIFISNIFAESF